MIALGGGRYAHARPGPGGNIVIVGSDKELATLIHGGSIYDLFRPEVRPPVDRLLAVVDEFRARSMEPPSANLSACGRISRYPGVIYSDGNLLALALLRACQTCPLLLGAASGQRLRDAVLVAAEDGEGRVLCSGFVHRVLDAAGARPVAPPFSKAFIDLSDFPTDEPQLEVLGSPFLFDWLLKKLVHILDLDQQTLRTCETVLHVISCHWDRRTPVPVPLHMANFLTPGDLAFSPSLHKVASRYRLPNGGDAGWKEGLPLPPFGPPLP
jgi:hypothetical protein